LYVRNKLGYEKKIKYLFYVAKVMKLFISNNLSGLNRTASELYNIKLRFKKTERYFSE